MMEEVVGMGLVFPPMPSGTKNESVGVNMRVDSERLSNLNVCEYWAPGFIWISRSGGVMPRERDCADALGGVEIEMVRRMSVRNILGVAMRMYIRNWVLRCK